MNDIEALRAGIGEMGGIAAKMAELDERIARLEQAPETATGDDFSAIRDEIELLRARLAQLRVTARPKLHAVSAAPAE
jgi:uncharacterized protein YdcH (DUF465 family)